MHICHASETLRCTRKETKPSHAAFVYPGVRVGYQGKAVVLAEADCAGDEDWTLEHAGAGTRLEDYDVDVSLRALCRLVCVHPLKLACPVYSPVHKL